MPQKTTHSIPLELLGSFDAAAVQHIICILILTLNSAKQQLSGLPGKGKTLPVGTSQHDSFFCNAKYQ